MVDLECDPDLHPRIEKEIGKGRRFITMLIEPDPHIRKPSRQIIFVEERHLRYPHSFPPSQMGLTRGEQIAV
jgi:hypothetical protein